MTNSKTSLPLNNSQENQPLLDHPCNSVRFHQGRALPIILHTVCFQASKAELRTGDAAMETVHAAKLKYLLSCPLPKSLPMPALKIPFKDFNPRRTLNGRLCWLSLYPTLPLPVFNCLALIWFKRGLHCPVHHWATSRFIKIKGRLISHSHSVMLENAKENWIGRKPGEGACRFLGKFRVDWTVSLGTFLFLLFFCYH